jgi:hypothetical protein
MKKKKVVILLIILFALVLVGINFIDIDSGELIEEEVRLQPNVGVATMEVSNIFTTDRISAIDTEHPDKPSWVSTVYAMDGLTGFEYDIDGDGLGELIAGSMERLLVLDDDSTEIIFFDGKGGPLWYTNAPQMVRVGDNEFVVITYKDACPGNPVGCDNWYYGKYVRVVNINSPAYAVGEEIAVLPFDPLTLTSPGNSRPGSRFMGDVVALPGGPPASIIATVRDHQWIATYSLSVNTDNTINFVQDNFLAPPPNVPSPTNYIRGNGGSRYKICIQDNFGVGTGECPWFILNNDIIEESTLTVISSWLSTNGMVFPYSDIQGDFTPNWDYGSWHVDSALFLNTGSAQNPYNIFIAMYNNGIAVAAKITIRPDRTVIWEPLYATSGGTQGIVICNTDPLNNNVCIPNSPVECQCPGQFGAGAEALALGEIKGLPGEVAIVNGYKIFRASDGTLLADMNIATTSNLDKEYLLGPRLTGHGFPHDDAWGFEVFPYSPVDILAQTLPEVGAYSNPSTGNSFWEVADNQLLSNAPFTYEWGRPGITKRTIRYDSNGNVYEGIIQFRNSRQAVSMKLINDYPIATALTQAEKDIVLRHLQDADGNRYDDTNRFRVDLAAIQGPVTLQTPTGVGVGLS